MLGEFLKGHAPTWRNTSLDTHRRRATEMVAKVEKARLASSPTRLQKMLWLTKSSLAAGYVASLTMIAGIVFSSVALCAHSKGMRAANATKGDSGAQSVAGAVTVAMLAQMLHIKRP